MKRILSLVLLFVVVYSTLNAQVSGLNELNKYIAGDRLSDAEQWVQVIKGDIPLVISVPHGGRFHDSAIPDRACSDEGRVIKGMDLNTKEIVLSIEEIFVQKYNKRPYIVISNISRRKVDQNREIELATCGHPQAIKAWNSYHDAIDAVLKYANKEHGDLFFVDVHGHGHEVKRGELGYNINASYLRKIYFDGTNDSIAQHSSLGNYLHKEGKEKLFSLLYGEKAFGTILTKNGYPSTPSLQDPHPKEGEPFFSGGYITRKYTSTAYPYVIGVQIELPLIHVRDTDANLKQYADSFARSYFDYVENL